MGESLTVALGDERGAHHRTDRDDGGGARTADRGEQHAREHAAHGHAARDPSDEGVREVDQPLADLSFAHDRAAHDEERDGQQGGAVGQAADALDDDRELVEVGEVAPEEQAAEGGYTDEHEQRGAHEGRRDDGRGEHPALAEERQEDDDRDHDEEGQLPLAYRGHDLAPCFEACAAATTASSSGAAPYEPPKIELKAAAT